MDSILNTHKAVKKLLTENPETRDDDFKLLYYVYSNYLDDIDNISFKDAILGHSKYKLPSFETVRRTRAKLQSKCEDLRPSATVRQYRAEQEEMYRDYANSSIEELDK